jgi:hypothetical protein
MTARLPGRWTDTLLCGRTQSSRERRLFFRLRRHLREGEPRNTAVNTYESESFSRNVLGKPGPGQLYSTGDSRAFIRLRTWAATDIIQGSKPSGNHFGIRQLRRSAKRKERTLDLQKILSELKAERDRLVRAIEALLGIASSSVATKRSAGGARRPGRRRSGITPEGRRRLSEAMKKRWAERRKKRS